MQKTTPHLPTDNLYWIAESKNKNEGIISHFKSKSSLSLITQIPRVPGEKDYLFKLVKSYKYVSMLRNSNPDGTREKFKTVLNRIRYKAESLITKAESVDDDSFTTFNFNDRNFAKKRAFRKFITGFIMEYMTSNINLIEYFKKEAETGCRVSFEHANELIEESNLLCQPPEIPRKWITIQDYNVYGELEDYEKLVDMELSDEEKKSLITTRTARLLELSDLINKEINLRNKQKSKRANLCYFILYDENLVIKPEYKIRLIAEQTFSEPLPEEIIKTLTIDMERVKQRILDLSVTNLKELVRIICKVHNDKFKQEIIESRVIKKREMRNEAKPPKKDFTSAETKEFIKLYKADGLTQKQVAQAVGCNLSTVKRGWH